MDKRTFDGPRWTVAFGDYEGLEGYAVDELYKVVQRSLPYILTAAPVSGDAPESAGYNVLLAGTPASNPRIAALVREGRIVLGSRPGSFAIKVFSGPATPARTTAAK